MNYKEMKKKYINAQNYIVSYTLYGLKEFSGTASLIKVFKTRDDARKEKKKLKEFYPKIKNLRIHRISMDTLPVVK